MRTKHMRLFRESRELLRRIRAESRLEARCLPIVLEHLDLAKHVELLLHEPGIFGWIGSERALQIW